jgi:polyketide cyclase/dehydrase/lipid transport protein
MLKITLFVLAALVAGLLLYAASRPDEFRVQRSVRIAAPAPQVHALIHDLQRFNTWNPYNRKDPDVKGQYSGPAAGPGAAYAFQGNKDVGKGSLTILDSQPPQRVTMRLDMLAPFEGHNQIDFTLVPAGAASDATDVTWAMHGPASFVPKLMGIFFDMDKMIGRDFEAGLLNLKAAAETSNTKDKA